MLWCWELTRDIHIHCLSLVFRDQIKARYQAIEWLTLSFTKKIRLKKIPHFWTCKTILARVQIQKRKSLCLSSSIDYLQFLFFLFPRSNAEMNLVNWAWLFYFLKKAKINMQSATSILHLLLTLIIVVITSWNSGDGNNVFFYDTYSKIFTSYSSSALARTVEK